MLNIRPLVLAFIIPKPILNGVKEIALHEGPFGCSSFGDHLHDLMLVILGSKNVCNMHDGPSDISFPLSLVYFPLIRAMWMIFQNKPLRHDSGDKSISKEVLHCR